MKLNYSITVHKPVDPGG